MSEGRDEGRIRRILGRPLAVATPPFDDLSRRPTTAVRRSIAFTVAAVLVAVAALYGGRELSAFRERQASPTAGVAAPSESASPKVVLPQPIPQPITRTSPAAQVAWVQTFSQLASTVEYLGTDPSGRTVGKIVVTDAEPGRAFRSADGASIVIVGSSRVTAYSALDGSKQLTYAREPSGGVIDVAFSPDGRWLALIGTQAFVQVIELRTGHVQTTPLEHDPKASTPGMSGTFTGPIWSTLAFSPDSKRLYTIVDWGGPLRLTGFDVTLNGLFQTASAVNGQGGKTFPSCDGPGLAPRVTPDGRTLVVFCHMDGSVWVVDLATFTVVADKRSFQTNPFELSPVFTPDGQLVYLRGATRISAFDVASRSLVAPVIIPRRVGDPGPFSWLFTQADAGYIASTVPVSPDGTKLYLSGSDGITVLRIPDLKPIAKLAPGLNLGEVWVSGDGRTIYSTDLGHGLYVMPESGGDPIVVPLPGQNGGYFIASEHG